MIVAAFFRNEDAKRESTMMTYNGRRKRWRDLLGREGNRTAQDCSSHGIRGGDGRCGLLWAEGSLPRGESLE